MQRQLVVSTVLHIAIVGVAYFGLPAPRPDDTPLVETALSVELVEVAETSNLPPAPSPKLDVEPEDKPKPQARAPEPVKREQPPPPAPPVVAEPPPDPTPAPKAEAAPVAPAPVAEPAPAPVLTPKKKAEAPPRPVAEPKPEAEEPKKAEPEAKKPPAQAKAAAEPDKPKREEELDFAAVLKSLESPTRQATPGPAAPGAAVAGSDANAESKSASTNYDAGLPVSVSEIDAVRRQIEQCWNLPAGARDAPDLQVRIVVQMNADGTPRSAAITDQSLVSSGPYHRVAAESALRAVLNPRCHPFKLPREKYDRWKTMTLVFDPKEMFGT